MPGGPSTLVVLPDTLTFESSKPLRNCQLYNMTNTSRPQVSRGYSAPALQYSNSSNSSPSSTSSPTDSYFSSQAPSTGPSSAISPASPYPLPPGLSLANSASPDYPIITATVTSRNPSGGTCVTNSSSAHDETLGQFSLHIPNPPMLSMGGVTQQPAPAVYSPMHNNTPTSRTASTPGYDDLPSPMDRSRRMPQSCHAPQMTVSSTTYYHTLCVKLPEAIQPEMVTVCAYKGDKLKIVADAWHMENESHYEWQIGFPPRDIDMSAVHARFDAEKNLTIDVRRIFRLHR